MITPIRASAVLTNSYVAGTVISYATLSPSGYNQLNLLVAFTIGSLTDGRIKVEFSHDGTTYFQDTFEAISGTTSTLSLGEYVMAGTGNYVISVPIKFNYIKISAKGTGTVTNSLLVVDAVLGIV